MRSNGRNRQEGIHNHSSLHHGMCQIDFLDYKILQHTRYTVFESLHSCKLKERVLKKQKFFSYFFCFSFFYSANITHIFDINLCRNKKLIKKSFVFKIYFVTLHTYHLII